MEPMIVYKYSNSPGLSTSPDLGFIWLISQTSPCRIKNLLLDKSIPYPDSIYLTRWAVCSTPFIEYNETEFLLTQRRRVNPGCLALNQSMKTKFTSTKALQLSGFLQELWISWLSLLSLIQDALNPKTNNKLSIKFDFPDPFGPTTLEKLEWKGPICTLPAQDLKFYRTMLSMASLLAGLSVKAGSIIIFKSILFQNHVLMQSCKIHKGPLTSICCHKDCKAESACFCEHFDCKAAHEHEGHTDCLDLAKFAERVRKQEKAREGICQYFNKLKEELWMIIDKQLNIAIHKLYTLKFDSKVSLDQVGQIQAISQGLFSHLTPTTVRILNQIVRDQLRTSKIQKQMTSYLDIFQKQGSAVRAKMEKLAKTKQLKQLLLVQQVARVDSVLTFPPSKVIDQSHLYLLQKILEKRAVKTNLQLIYRGSDNKFSAQDFHLKCDNRSPVLVLVKTSEGQVIGGYSNAAFDSKGKFIADLTGNSFLFSLTKNMIFQIYPDKLQRALMGNKKFGPEFGDGCDLYICDQCHRKAQSGSRLGRSFRLEESRRGEDQTFLCGVKHFLVKQYQVFSS